MRDRLRSLLTLLSGRRARWVIDWGRRILLPIALIYGTYYFGAILSRHYAIQNWLVWRYAAYWLASGAFTLACVSSGNRVLTLFGPPREGLRERLVVSFGLGVLVFIVSMFLLGLLGLLLRPVFFVLPAVLIVAGGRPAIRLARQCIGAARTRPRLCRPRSLVDRMVGLGAVLFGVIALLVVYVGILHPENVSFDARWYHLGIAEQYVSEGAIRRFPEGYYVGAFPQLASLIYTWAFLHPGKLFDHVALCAHLEFTVLLWTLLGVTVLAQRLVPRGRPRHAWVAVFLFPGMFLYDSALGCGADHIAAFWAPLVFLALLRVYRRPSPRAWFLAAAFVSGACLTKYTAASMVIFPLLALVARSIWELGRSLIARRFDPAFWRGPAVGVATGLIVTAPHWLKNWLWYGNPVYPMSAGRFHNRPWSDEAARAFDLKDMGTWVPQGSTGDKLYETLKALYKFSFVPHDFPQFHGVVPVFGSLFTLCLLPLPFLRGTRRIWALVAATHVGVFFWYWTQHEDRYLQALVPWMAAVVASVAALAWRSHVVAKITVAALVGLQIVWGGDVPFFPTHAMLKKAPVELSVRFLSSGYRKEKNRLDVFGDMALLGKTLPPDARVLLHEYNPRLGIGRPIVTDSTIFQADLAYSNMKSPRELYEKLRSYGVTHAVWIRRRSRSWHSLAGDLVFQDLLARHTGPAQSAGSFQAAPLVDAEDEPSLGDTVLYLGCNTGYTQGLYARQDMNVLTVRSFPRSAYPKPQTPLGAPADAAALVQSARYVVHEKKCFKDLPAAVTSGFVSMTDRGGAQLWVRRPRKASALAAAPAGSAAPVTAVPGEPVPGDQGDDAPPEAP